MAFGQTTSYQTTGAKLSVGGYTFGLQSATNVDSISRSDNKITVSGANVRIKITGSGSSFSGIKIYGAFSLPQGSTRVSRDYIRTGGSPGDDNGGNEYNFSFNVGADDTTSSTNNGGAYDTDGISWAGGQSIDIPNLGTPDGTTYFVSSTTNSIVARNNVTTWGAYGTADYTRIYYSSSDTEPDTNDSYVSVSDNVNKTITGLTHNTKYYFRGYQSNGGGKSGYSNTVTGITNPIAAVAGTPDVEAVSATIPVTQSNGGGAYSITKQYRLLKTGGAWGAWTTFATNIELTGLLPSSEYQVQVRSTTSAGTTTGGTTTFTTLPAAKLVMPDGTVLNAIPRVVHPDGTVKMVKVKHL